MGEWMARIKSHWRENWENYLRKIAVSILFLFLGQIRIILDMNAVFVQYGNEIILKALLRFGHQPQGYLADGCQLLCRCHPIRGYIHHTSSDLLLKSRNPDHEKFIQIVAYKCHELDAFQRWIVLVESFLQHPSLKIQQTQLTVEKQFWIVQVNLNFNFLLFFFFFCCFFFWRHGCLPNHYLVQLLFLSFFFLSFDLAVDLNAPLENGS